LTTKLSLPVYYTGQPMGYYWKIGEGGDSYDDVHDAEEADWHDESEARGVNALEAHYNIARGLFTVDLTNFPVGETFAQIYLKGYFMCESTYKNVYAVIVDGRNIYGQSGAFGIFKNRTTPLGRTCIPVGTEYGWYSIKIPFNAQGWSLLEEYAGSFLTLGLRIDQDIEAIAPGSNELQRCFLYKTIFSGYTYLWVEYSATPRYIWVDKQNFKPAYTGTKLAYIDDYGAKRTKLGTPTGVTGKQKWQIAVHDIYLEYIDYEYPSTNCRRIEGTLTGVTGKVPFQIGINGTKLCYIDDTGAERCFEGTIG